jgi:protein O-GlcNAc transferase
MKQADSKQARAAKVCHALECYRNGNLAGAEALYREVLSQEPTHADALHLLGCLLETQGQADAAIQMLLRATAANPIAYPYFYNLGNMLVKAGRLDEAVQQYRTAIQLKPDYASAYNNLGMALRKQGHRAESRQCFKAAVRFLPDYADAHYNLGLELRADGELTAAIASYRKAVLLKPDYADAMFALGNAYSLLNRVEDAKAAYLRAIQAQPDSPKAYMNLGTVQMRMGQLDEAVSCFKQALRLDPQDAFTHSNLILAASYMSADPAETYAQCEQWQRGFAPQVEELPTVYTNEKQPSRRLRIGYVSGDFRSHAAAYWIHPLLEGHQHTDFEIHCYSNAEDADGVTNQLRQLADHWTACAEMTDHELSQRIRQDGIDILVDLSGHTDGNRLKVFALQPAPVQVSWFGFPVSTGLTSIQYRFTDTTQDPVGESERYYSEQLVRLPRFYAAFKPDAGTPAPGKGSVSKKGFVTFASFNNFAKITPQVLLTWSEILLAVPKSKLIIQAAGVDGPDLSKRIRSFFAERGVASARIELRGWTGLSDYLRLGQQADIALDPYPFNGGVTTCHALWMGLPVVTMYGQSAASRVGKSILSHVGLTELVADTPQHYKKIAVDLALDIQRVADLRASLRQRMTDGGLLDGATLAHEAETAYRVMWHTWCSSTQQT